MRLPENIADLKIAVIGDIMLDRYWWGSVERISPEAPVPIVRLDKSTVAAGGAANVAANVAGLGASANLIGICGDDDKGSVLREVLLGLDRVSDSIITIAGRPTTIKTRIVAHGQHVVRIDHERSEPISDDETEKLLPQIFAGLDNADAIIISDYAKGFLTTKMLANIIDHARREEKVVFVDPKSKNFNCYRNSNIITPNLKEALDATGKKDVVAAGRAILGNEISDAVLITEGENGMTLFEKHCDPFHLDALAHEVFDVTGAGDTVIAAFTVASAGGLNFREAAQIANVAAGLAVAHAGTTVVTSDQIKDFASF